MKGDLWRSLKAFAAGMLFMILAVKVRDHGTDAIDAWNVAGVVGMIGLFLASLPSFNTED